MPALGVPPSIWEGWGNSNFPDHFGIKIDSQMEQIHNEVAVWVSRKTVSKKQILPLVGQLQHATKTIRPSRTFVARMNSISPKLRELTFSTSLTKGFKSDAYWWHILLQSRNWLNLLDQTRAGRSMGLLYTDRCLWWRDVQRSLVPMALVNWVEHRREHSQKELVQILISHAIWGLILAGDQAFFVNTTIGA